MRGFQLSGGIEGEMNRDVLPKSSMHFPRPHSCGDRAYDLQHSFYHRGDGDTRVADFGGGWSCARSHLMRSGMSSAGSMERGDQIKVELHRIQSGWSK